ncbi:MAG: ATP synthase F1 subunit delta [Dehalococcoidales bacterium]|nr:ATP synthase F1 subunit delta [Dehalococcoidales bacterium]
MARKSQSRRYAQAVFELALAANQIDKWQEDLVTITGVIGDAAFAAYLESPKVRFADKEQKLAERLKIVNPLALNLVRLLITRGKINILGDVTEEYRRLADRYHGIERAQVITAVSLGHDEQKKVIAQLEKITGKKILVNTGIEPALIGGIVARIDGKLLDGSTRSRLAALKKVVAGAGK